MKYEEVYPPVSYTHLDVYKRQEHHGTPEIFNTDQGSQFTSEAFTGVLKGQQIRISMDGKGRALDNIFVERLWRSMKYEEVYPQQYQSLREANAGLSAYFQFYNTCLLYTSRCV